MLLAATKRHFKFKSIYAIHEFSGSTDRWRMCTFTEESPKSITADTNFLTYNVTRLGVVQGSIKIHLESNQNYIQFINNDLELQLNLVKPNKFQYHS